MFFAVHLERGEAWDSSRDLREQDGWDEHARFMDSLVEEGFIVLGGPLVGQDDVLHAISAPSEAAVRERLAQDSWHQNGLLRIRSIEAWTILLDGRRPYAMPLNRSIPTATTIPVLIYPDVRAAVKWLTEAFGFAERLQIGEDHRSQMKVGEGGAVIIGDVRSDRRPPRQGEVTHSVLVRVKDATAHCERARAHGAKILNEPTDHMYGERQYSAEDPWGHQWTFSETLADVDPGDWGGIARE